MDKLPGARYMNQCARMAHKIKAQFRTLRVALVLNMMRGLNAQYDVWP